MGLYFGGVYFGEYAPARAAAPAAGVPAGPSWSAAAWPGQATHRLRRGWRWHRAFYDVLLQGERIGRRRTFAAALELGHRRGVDRIEKLNPSGGRVVRRWLGPELAAVLERFARRYR